LGNVFFDAIDIGDNGFGAVFVVFHLGEFEQFFGVSEAGTDLVNAANNAFEDGAFFTEVLRPLRIIPNFRVFQFAADLF
jgi:hypothetical protein